MIIALGGDHAGFSLKKELISYISSLGYFSKDFGPFSEESCDYPDFAHQVASSVAAMELDLGFLVCGSGNGVAMTANKHSDIRAALCWNPESARLSRAHNNANILCLPARFISLEEAKEISRVFLETKFEEGRHFSRVQKINL